MAEVMTLNNGGLDTTPWWKQRWPWLLMLGPAVVVVASTYTGYLAYTQQDALVVGDYYKQGKAINQDLRRDHVAASMGLSVSLGYDAGSGTLSGRFQQQSGARPEQLMLLLSHATQPEKDIKLVVRPDSNGDFHAALPMLERSRWTVLAESAQRDWRLAGIWQWPDKRGVALNADAVQPAE